MPSVPTPSRSGIITDAESGERHIPASVRADGSTRREIKIRPGYKPPEDIEVYKNRTADAFRNRGGTGVPGAEGLKEEKEQGAASNKNAKRREARKKAKANEDSTLDKEKTSDGKTEKNDTAELEQPVDPEIEREKKVRNLKKKLKQAKELKEKKEGGAALLPEQFAKVIKINELIRELDSLGFNAEGEPN